MQFAFRGFEQRDGMRLFKFSSANTADPEQSFQFLIQLELMTKNGVTVQELPSLCFELLNGASRSGPDHLAKYVDYTLDQEDFQTFTAPRRAQQAARANRQPTHLNRRKPPEASQPDQPGSFSRFGR